MSKIIATAAINGAYKIVKQAEESLANAIEQKGRDCKVEFPNTGYYMPIIYSMTGRAVGYSANLEVQEAVANSVITNEMVLSRENGNAEWKSLFGSSDRRTHTRCLDRVRLLNIWPHNGRDAVPEPKTV